MEMSNEYLEYILVGAGLLVLGLYNGWLLYTIIRFPKKTVIGLNAESRRQWVYAMMSDPKNGVLAVQTIRNNLMASTGLATISITLSSLISAYVSSTSSTTLTGSYNTTTTTTSSTIYTLKYFAILLCFLLAFFGFMQNIRYYAHVSFLINSPSPRGRKHHVDYVAKILDRGSHFWSLGMRAFYVAFPLLIWIFGPLPMLLCSCFMTFVLYFLDTPNCFSSESIEDETGLDDTDSDGDSILETGQSRDSHVSTPLLRDGRP